MGIFDSIKDAIWGRAEAATPDEVKAEGAAPAAPAATPAATAATTAAAPAAAGAAAAAPEIDVAMILDTAVKTSGQKLDWRNSIVDLMKALNMDSSLANRKQMATEMGYTGDMGDSAKMNIWLHEKVIAQLKGEGGKL